MDGKSNFKESEIRGVKNEEGINEKSPGFSEAFTLVGDTGFEPVTLCL